MSAALRVGIASAVASAAILAVFLLSGAYEPVDLLFPGQRGVGAEITARDFGLERLPDRFSYDGQEIYVIARELPDLDAASDAGVLAFRMRRILQPAIASIPPPGTPTVLTLAGLNVLGVGLAAGALADLAARHGRDPRGGYAAAVMLSFPLIITTTEPLAFGLGLFGLALVDRSRWGWATAALALAGLSRETALVMAVAAALTLVWRGHRAVAFALLAGSTLPLAVWSLWLGQQVPADTYRSSKLLGFLDMPAPSLVDVLSCSAAVVLMVAGVWRWRDVPLLALTSLGFLACCAFYIGDQYQFHGLPRVSAAAMAIGAAGLLPFRRRPPALPPEGSSRPVAPPLPA